ncbi:hypothetical protein NQD34_016545 [Periophthalmus magnuspinnatus]|nr:hypothetical protein NQD34_016545 [Periophthalmus magnuspinnatus]
MSVKSLINKEVFSPHDEKMLVACQVKRRTKKKIPFLATGGQGDYTTFICLAGQTLLGCRKSRHFNRVGVVESGCNHGYAVLPTISVTVYVTNLFRLRMRLF